MKTVIRPESEMKDSGIEWIGDIPKDWNIAPIKVNFDIYAGATPSSNNPIYWDGDIAWITPADYKTEDKYVSCGKRHISQDGYDNCSAILVPANSIIFSKRAPIGTVAISKNELCTNQGCLSCVSKDDSNIEFYYYAMSIATEEFELKGSGTTFKEISLANFKNFRFAVPPLSEQQAIADYLDETCSKIDEIIAEAKASIDEYKELKQAVIFEAVTKGLDKNVEMKESGVKAIGKVKHDYHVVKISELNSGLTDGTHGTYARLDSGKLLLSSKNVQNKGLVIGDNESYISEEDSNSIVANGFPQKNDLLLCCIGASIGRCILYPLDYPIAFQRSVIFIRCNEWILPKMMMYNLKSSALLMQEQMLVNTSAQAGLYQGLVKQLYVVVPPSEEQKKIVNFLDKRTTEIDSLITEKESLINDLEAYKKSLIYEVVTGKRKVV